MELRQKIGYIIFIFTALCIIINWDGDFIYILYIAPPGVLYLVTAFIKKRWAEIFQALGFFVQGALSIVATPEAPMPGYIMIMGGMLLSSRYKIFGRFEKVYILGLFVLLSLLTIGLNALQPYNDILMNTLFFLAALALFWVIYGDKDKAIIKATKMADEAIDISKEAIEELKRVDDGTIR
jgi:hypothetical protein